MRRWVLVALVSIVPVARAAPAPSVLVTTIPVRTGSIPQSVTGYGTIGAGPGGSETMTIAYAGIVTRLDVAPGQTVRRGQALAVIATAPRARAAYAQAEAAVRAAAAALADTRRLVAAHLATTIQLAQAEQAVQVAVSARDALRLEGAGRAQTTLTAPYDGVVSSVAVGSGAVLMAGGAVLTLVRADALVAKIGLDPQQADEVHVGDPVAVMRFTPAGRAVRGRVTAIGGMVDPLSGLLDATIALPASGFLVGQPVDAEIDVGTARGVIVPRDAALPVGQGFRIWQVEDGHARPVAVRIVARTAGSAVVRGAIDPALPIVATGNYQLTQGIAVRVTH